MTSGCSVDTVVPCGSENMTVSMPEELRYFRLQPDTSTS
jgi:hypothetical protein